MRTLLNWSIGTLGLSAIDAQSLSLYIPGCKQNWDNDSGIGRFAYVYSLTKNERRTTGGETLVMREGDATRRFLTPGYAGYQAFYETVAPKFNRLVIFDD